MICRDNIELMSPVIKKRIEVALTQAPHEFSILFQPIWWLHSLKRPWGFEVLTRWSSPFNIGPSVFIPIIETEPILRRQLTLLITKLVVQEIRLFILREPQITYFTMNVSFNDLNEGEYVNELGKIITEHPYVVNRLFLEVTETSKIVMTDTFMKSLETLKELGVRVGLDDLGAGYADQDALMLPIWSMVKTDRSHVHNIGNVYESTHSLIKLLETCLSFTSYVVIEGIELAKQHLALQRTVNKNVMVQGYYYARPMASNVILEKYFNSKNATLAIL
ncbi:TPA: EAL domain-containing protein [Vibrio parahaemolyticus]|uniref:EAL domain-containing protein n=3 Tax=Vibrio parahaemolyticus TaxID=670 RepID=UPI00042275C6|nr:EAL domain-containing protein [Vibrio parahaemolyticus]EGQ8011616.1 EAL domain-containing protein [Vibrio parahaemolyticus]EGQ8033684.1 EAL domain-containing protein [Vibrio parahaemolyticus]EGQ8062106.1 EAL domain-containing protein [Vibrio parahaemolyticus]EGQ8927246.1 EAL domain-containing protein [Vibrio parahaemolyticus]EGQ9117088.1 hypothetical protein [Vibrio parahaemolyticus]